MGVSPLLNEPTVERHLTDELTQQSLTSHDRMARAPRK